MMMKNEISAVKRQYNLAQWQRLGKIDEIWRKFRPERAA